VGNYRLSEGVNLTLGVENLLDNFTQHSRLITVRNNGRQYPGGAPYENDGRQLYARVGIKF
jgi:outer membrane receptor for ferrienterochelin and colicin